MCLPFSSGQAYDPAWIVDRQLLQVDWTASWHEPESLNPRLLPSVISVDTLRDARIGALSSLIASAVCLVRSEIVIGVGGDGRARHSGVMSVGHAGLIQRVASARRRRGRGRAGGAMPRPVRRSRPGTASWYGTICR